MGLKESGNDQPELSGCVLSKESHENLYWYLVGHEYDIATGTNDFGELVDIFKELIKRTPKTGKDGKSKGKS